MNQIARTEERQVSPSQQFRDDLSKMGDQFAAALPSHIKPEKFQRVVMTAVLSDPDILRADRKSLMESAIRAAQDGLLPDKREGAFVTFNTKVNVNGKAEWIKAVQWMPMVGGIIKRIHQSGEIKMLTARVVYGGDHFRTWIDDTGEHIEYEPGEDQDVSVVRRVFAMATTVDGAVYVEPLSAKDVEKIRNVSRSKEKGPWADWWEEMAKKSAIRRLAKRLPLSVDLHDLIQRDNGLFDLQQEAVSKPTLNDRLKAARNITPEPQDEQEGFSRAHVARETSDALTGEIIDQPNSDGAETSQAASDTDGVSPPPSGQEDGGVAASSSSASPSSTDQPDLLDEASPQWLTVAARMLWAATNTEGNTDENLELLNNQRKAIDVPANATQGQKEKAGSIYKRCKSVVMREEDPTDTIAIIAGIAGCTENEVDGSAANV